MNTEYTVVNSYIPSIEKFDEQKDAMICFIKHLILSIKKDPNNSDIKVKYDPLIQNSYWFVRLQ